MFLLDMLHENSLVEIIEVNAGNVEDVFFGNEQAEVACCLGVITSAAVHEDLPEIENY